MLIRLFLLLFLTSCTQKLSPPFLTINPEFKSYIEVYNKIKITETGQHVGYYPMEFGDLPNNQLGLASTNYETCWITINKKYWNYLDENGKKELIFHELLHCDYVGFYHIDGTIMDQYHSGTKDPEADLKFIFNNY